MMKRLLFVLVIPFLFLVAYGQTYEVNISGYVEDIDTGDPIGGQMVQVFTDSIPADFFYYNTVFTNEAGYFEDTFDVPSGVSGELFVLTAGCEGTYLVEEVSFSENSNDFTFNFLTCTDPGGGGEECQALFYYYPADNALTTIHFIDISTGNPNSWFWDFGDGGTSEEQNPIHTYASEGDYPVTLTISNDSLECFSTLVMLVSVGDTIIFPDSCQAMFYSYPNEEDPLTVYFVDLSIGNGEDMPDNWFWSFGDGATSSEQNPVHTYTEEGTYEVCLTINTEDSSCVDTHCEFVEVVDWNNLCDAQFFYYPVYDSFPLVSNAIQFIDISFGDPTSWDWDFGDGNTSTEQNPVHIYADTGMYTVCLSIANPEDSCYSTLCQDVYLMNDTVYDCLAWFDYTIQEGLQVDFNGMATSDSDEAQFTWDFGDGTTGSGQSISHTYEENGLYSVIMTFTDSVNGCYTIYTDFVQLGDEFNFEIAGYVYLEDSVAVDLADVYLLTFDTIGEELISVAETVTGDNGYYQFEEEFGQNFIYFVQADLQPGSSEFGNYLPTYHYDALTWQEAWPVFPFPTGTSYDIMMIAAEGVESGGGEITGTVSGEVREYMGNVEIVLLDEEGNALAYTRTDENGYFSFSGIAFGSYYVHTEMPGVVGEPLMVSLHEENDSENLNIVIKDGEALLNLSEAPRAGLQSVSEVFPNPVSDQVSVSIALNNASRLEVVIRNNFGNVVIKQEDTYSAGVHQLKLDIRHLPDGIYFMDIVSETGLRTVRKLVKL